MDNELFYLDTYILQQDMRIRMPKTILANMSVEKGKTKFSIFLNRSKNEIILKVVEPKEDT